MAATVERFGAVDILVNNAATNPYFGPIMDLDSGRADKTVRVNQTGYLEWVQAAWRSGMSERGGVVLNLASVGGLSVERGIGWYNVTKAAVIHLTSQMAGELGPGVRVNALAPGLVKTEFARALWETGRGVDRPPAAVAPPRRGRRHRQRRPVPVLGRRLVDHRSDPGHRRRRHVHRQRRHHLTVRARSAGSAEWSVERRPADLAARGPGQGLDHHHLTRGGPAGQPGRHQVAELVEGRGSRRVPGHHPGHDPLTPLRVGSLPHRHLVDAGVTGQDLLDG